MKYLEVIHWGIKYVKNTPQKYLYM